MIRVRLFTRGVVSRHGLCGDYALSLVTRDDVYNQIKELNDRVGGFGHLLFFGQGGFLDHADTAANITLFAKEVRPRLRQLNPEPVKAAAIAAAQ